MVGVSEGKKEGREEGREGGREGNDEKSLTRKEWREGECIVRAKKSYHPHSIPLILFSSLLLYSTLLCSDSQ